MSIIANHLSSYPEVNTLLQELLENARNILGSRWVGIYLFGSLTSGDFDQDSDIDVIIVTDDEISDVLLSALRTMHLQLAAGDSPWATQLEVSYIPRSALRRYDPTQTLHPRLERGRGERLHLQQHDSTGVIQRYALREHGLTLAGPSPQTLIDPISPNDLRRAMMAFLPEWGTHLLANPTPLTNHGYQSYIVLTLCRVLYTLHFGTTVSKRVAARWAQETWEERWAALIERAWIGRHQPHAEAPMEDVRGTLDLIRYVLQHAQQFEIPGDEAERSDPHQSDSCGR